MTSNIVAFLLITNKQDLDLKDLCAQQQEHTLIHFNLDSNVHYIIAYIVTIHQYCYCGELGESRGNVHVSVWSLKGGMALIRLEGVRYVILTARLICVCVCVCV